MISVLICTRIMTVVTISQVVPSTSVQDTGQSRDQHLKNLHWSCQMFQRKHNNEFASDHKLQEPQYKFRSENKYVVCTLCMQLKLALFQLLVTIKICCSCAVPRLLCDGGRCSWCCGCHARQKRHLPRKLF